MADEEAGGAHPVVLGTGSPASRGGEHYPQTLVVENLARRGAKELLGDSLPGGMMGGYIEEGLSVLLYQQPDAQITSATPGEEEFVSDIGGMVSNCMHPDDRAAVDAEVARQIAERANMVEYRMKKQNGSYIWVHDLGRRITAENGMPAIISVCLDITAQKTAQAEVMHPL